MTVYARWVRAPHAAGGPRGDGGSVHLVHRRKRKAQVCEGFDEQTELEQLRETIRKQYLPADPGSGESKRARQLVTRHLKRLFRCTGDSAEGEAIVRDLMPDADADRAIADSETPLGGYTAAVAKWAGPTNTAFKVLGAEIRQLAEHTIPGEDWGPGTPYTKVEHRSESTKSAAQNEPILKAVDIVGCSGHHYTSHLAPGFFTNDDSARGFDLRYNLHKRPDGFPEVALVAVSGCSSLCTLAQRVLRPCFPSARFLGARATMTLDAGKWIWPTFQDSLRDAATPLLLDNDQDVEQIAQAWIRSCITMTHHEAIRVLVKKKRTPTEFRVNAMQKQLIKNTGLGYVQKDRVFLLADAGAGLVEGGVGDAGNGCERKADDRHTLVPPKGFVLPTL